MIHSKVYVCGLLFTLNFRVGQPQNTKVYVTSQVSPILEEEVGTLMCRHRTSFRVPQGTNMQLAIW